LRAKKTFRLASFYSQGFARTGARSVRGAARDHFLVVLVPEEESRTRELEKVHHTSK